MCDPFACYAMHYQYIKLRHWMQQKSGERRVETFKGIKTRFTGAGWGEYLADGEETTVCPRKWKCWKNTR
jgi:hypothetical protein